MEKEKLDPVEQAEIEYQIEKKRLLTDGLKFLQNDELQTMLIVIVIIALLRWIDALTQPGFEKLLLLAIGAGFGADGLNKLTNRKIGGE